MRLERLKEMGISEIAYRSRQEAWKLLERAGVDGKANRRPRIQSQDHRAAAGALWKDFHENGANRFFQGAASEKTPATIKEHLPGAREEILAAAEAVSAKRFDLLAYRGLFFGDPIDWHFDPISQRRAPLLHWSQIDPLDRASVGDSKIIWELNRHQWLVCLGEAYRLTGDERYGEAFADFIRDWTRANPPGIGINRASSLELALRIVSWCWALFLFRGSLALSAELFSTVVEEISLHAAHVEKYLSYYFAPNTHLTGEALGLFYAGLLFPGLPGAERRRDLGARILLQQSGRQIFSDGVYFEQSTCYQRYACEIYLHFLILAARNGLNVPSGLADQVQKMLDFLLAVRRPDGAMPQIGDDDGGWLLPLAPRAPDDFRGLFALAAAWFGRSDYAWAAGGPAPEIVWLLGEPGMESFDRLQPAPPSSPPSRLFADGGYAVMRSGWDAGAHPIIFDVGPLGSPISDGHAHADLLSIQCAVSGGPLIVDSGTCGYTAEPEWRDFFRSSAAHSTVIIDDESQAAPAGPFLWRTRPQARLREWISTEAYDFADAEHDGYRSLPDPVVHRRRVVFIKPRYWLVMDDVEGAAEHRVEIRFQFAPMNIAVDSNHWVHARGSRGFGLFIKAFAVAPLGIDVREGELEPIQGWVSPNYGLCQAAPLLKYSTEGRLPLRILTLLFPTNKASDSPPEVSLLLGEGPMPVGLVFGGGHERVSFSEQGIALKIKKRSH